MLNCLDFALNHLINIHLIAFCFELFFFYCFVLWAMIAIAICKIIVNNELKYRKYAWNISLPRIKWVETLLDRCCCRFCSLTTAMHHDKCKREEKNLHTFKASELNERTVEWYIERQSWKFGWCIGFYEWNAQTENICFVESVENRFGRTKFTALNRWDRKKTKRASLNWCLFLVYWFRLQMVAVNNFQRLQWTAK